MFANITAAQAGNFSTTADLDAAYASGLISERHNPATVIAHAHAHISENRARSAGWAGTRPAALRYAVIQVHEEFLRQLGYAIVAEPAVTW